MTLRPVGGVILALAALVAAAAPKLAPHSMREQFTDYQRPADAHSSWTTRGGGAGRSSIRSSSPTASSDRMRRIARAWCPCSGSETARCCA
jgi:hypothetical protein